MRIQIRLQPDQLHNTEVIERLLAKKARSPIESLRPWYVAKRSIDARGKQPVYVLAIETRKQRSSYDLSLSSVLNRPEVHIVGSGPAGYFAALKVIEAGMRPIVLERGKDVKTRRRDLRALQQYGVVHPDSNYCFGEGGAGTYSDGKLYTRSVKRGRIEDILQILVAHGAPSDILVDAHPHIGSNKLPRVVGRLRETIEAQGGEVRFDSRVTNIEAHKGRIQKLVINDAHELKANSVILATGHSARDIYLMFYEKGWQLDFKPFAMGVRIEHPQSLIDDIQYGPGHRGEDLPAASYSLTCQVDLAGVFSFCMCPGGLIVPAATAPAELVVNGMSLSRRDSPFANAGTVVEIDQALITSKGYNGVLGGMNFQRDTERVIWHHGSGDQAAPAQRLTDFVKGVLSTNLPETFLHTWRVFGADGPAITFLYLRKTSDGRPDI